MTPIELDQTEGIVKYGWEAKGAWDLVVDPAWDVHMIYQMLWEMLRK